MSRRLFRELCCRTFEAKALGPHPASSLYFRLDIQFDAPTVFRAYAIDVIGMAGFQHDFRALDDLCGESMLSWAFRKCLCLPFTLVFYCRQCTRYVRCYKRGALGTRDTVQKLVTCFLTLWDVNGILISQNDVGVLDDLCELLSFHKSLGLPFTVCYWQRDHTIRAAISNLRPHTSFWTEVFVCHLSYLQFVQGSLVLAF